MIIIKSLMTPMNNKMPTIAQCKVYWIHTRLWDNSWISRYHAAAPGLAREIATRKVNTSELENEPIDGSPTGGKDANLFTCEDFVFEVIVEFASRNKLPLQIITEAGVFQNVDPNYLSGDKSAPPTPAGFAVDLAIATGAKDIIRNTISVSEKNIEPGDLILEDLKNHVQFITAVSPNRGEIIQGNFPGLNFNIRRGAAKLLGGGHIRYTTSGNRESPFYLGVPVQTAVYEKRNGIWLYQREYGTYHDWDNEVWDNMMNRRLRWNFLQFNYHGVIQIA